jgi:hypothetical protein
MSKLSKILAGLGILVAIVAIGLGIGWLATTGSTPKPPPPAVAATVNPAPQPAGHEIHPAPAPPALPVTTNIPGTGARTADNSSLPAAPVNSITNWEDKLDDILGSDTEDTNKVTQLFAMFPRLPKDGQEEVAQHLSNLVDDPDYAPLGQLLTNAKLSPDVLDVLMADLLNRPNATKLPTLLEIARNPDHPNAGEAKDLLELYLDEDYGTDWTTWQQKMQEWLKDNPD